MQIQFMSTVLFVKDIQASRRFYEGLLCQPVNADFGLNVEFAKGFAVWQADYGLETIFGEKSEESEPLGRRNAEVYFEAEDLDAVWARLAQAEEAVKVAHPIREQPWGQRVFRVYDPDRHIVEIGEPMGVTVRRFLADGMTLEQVAARTSMPLDMVTQMAAAPAH